MLDVHLNQWRPQNHQFQVLQCQKMSNESEPVQAVSCLRNQSDTRHEVTLSSFTSASVMTLNTQMCNSTSRIHVGRTFMKNTFTVVCVEVSRFFRFRFYVETTQCSGRVQAPKPPGKHHVLTLNTDPVTRVTVSSVSFSKTTDTFKMHISLFCNFTFLLGWIFYLSLVTTLRWSSGEVQENIKVQVKVPKCLQASWIYPVV